MRIKSLYYSEYYDLNKRSRESYTTTLYPLYFLTKHETTALHVPLFVCQIFLPIFLCTKYLYSIKPDLYSQSHEAACYRLLQRIKSNPTQRDPTQSRN